MVKTANFSQGAGGIAAGIGGGLMKALGENEQAKKWSEGVISYAKGAHLDQLGECRRRRPGRLMTGTWSRVDAPSPGFCLAAWPLTRVMFSMFVLRRQGTQDDDAQVVD